MDISSTEIWDAIRRNGYTNTMLETFDIKAFKAVHSLAVAKPWQII